VDKIKIKDERKNDSVTLTRNDSVIWQATGEAMDTLIYDAGLLPNHDYIYYAETYSPGGAGGFHPDSGLRITTMDTTSHNFTWQTWTWGAKGSSVLFDVAIINENDIWAVGEIYTEDTYTYDSLGNWIQPYNAVHWDGNAWELKRLMVKHPSWSEPHWISLEAVYAFSGNDIWFSSGNLHHYDSVYVNQHGRLKSYWLWDLGVLGSDDGGIKKMWGTSSNNLYGVGSKGTIVHYNGTTWRRIESPEGTGGTDNSINDIWGNDDLILATVSDKYDPGDLKILSINNLTVNSNKIHWPYLYKEPYSVWFENKNKILVCGAGLFQYVNNVISEDTTIHTTKFLNRIRGQNLVDIFVVGDFGFVGHFNGFNWRQYPELAFASIYQSLDYKRNIMISVGEKNSEVVILMMRK